MADPQRHDADRDWLRFAIRLSTQCPLASTAFSVGAVIVDADNEILATGYSRETDSTIHAEEAALAKLAADDPRLQHATLYSSMEPCGQRKSRPRTCVQLIIDAAIPRVVYALREPPIFVTSPNGAYQLRAAGVQVTQLPNLAADIGDINGHLYSDGGDQTGAP